MSAEALAAPAAATATAPAPAAAVARRRLRLASVDDYLGPGDRRFFGSGYRRVRHEVVDVAVGTADAGADPACAAATVTIEYPPDWSSKKGVDMRPHLSSVDILVLGTQLAEAALTHAHGLDEGDRARSWLRKVKLRAGLEPQEDLVGLPGSARRRSVRPWEEDAGWLVSTFDTKVGAMQARCEVVHPAGRPADGVGTATHATLEDLLGPAAGRHYGDGFKAKRPLIESVHVDVDGLAATAVVGPQAAGDPAAPSGLEADHQPSLSMVDTFVTCLQLSQVLMYELDGIERGDSHTLWMLRTTIEAPSPHRPWATFAPAQAAVTDTRLLPVGGMSYRNVDVVGACGDVSLQASLAHALPAHAHPTTEAGRPSA